MKLLQVFDPALCCSTGVCGPQVDPVLPRFAGDLEWLKQQGVTVSRFNLAQQPQAFVANRLVQEALQADPEHTLPLLLLNGKIVSRGVYPTREQLATWTGVSTSPAPAPTPVKIGCCGSSGCC